MCRRTYTTKRKVGKQLHTYERWIAILGEEFGEASKAVVERNYPEFRDELIQVATVALQIVQRMDDKDIVDSNWSLSDIGLVNDDTNPLEILGTLSLPQHIKTELANRIRIYGKVQAKKIRQVAVNLITMDHNRVTKNILNNSNSYI